MAQQVYLQGLFGKLIYPALLTGVNIIFVSSQLNILDKKFDNLDKKLDKVISRVDERFTEITADIAALQKMSTS